MKTDKQTDDLENLFGQILLEVPSVGFTEEMNRRLEKEIRRRERRQWWFSIWQAIAAIAGVLLLLAVASLFLPDFDFPSFQINIEIPPTVWAIGLTVLLLLLGDLLLRRRCGQFESARP